MFITIDPSISSSAVCIYDGHTTIIFCYSNKVKKDITVTYGNHRVLVKKQPKFSKDIDQFVRYYDIVKYFTDTLLCYLSECNAKEIYIEDYAMRATGRSFSIGEFVGMIKMRLHESNYNVHTLGITKWKKDILDHGNANKQMIYDYCITTDLGNIINKLMEETGKDYKEGSFIEDICDSYLQNLYIRKQGVKNAS